MVQLGDQVAIVGRVAQRLPADAGLIEVMDAKQLETAQDITGLLDTLGRFIWFVPLAFAALAIWLAGDRRRSICGRSRSERSSPARWSSSRAASPATTSSTTS